jgi:hypothetical protein
MNGNNKPVLFTPQSFYYCWVKIEDTGNRNRVPTVRETKAMAYIALSRNAKGLLWFPYRQWHHPTQMVKFSLKKGGFYNLDELYFDLWDGIESLCKDLKTLFPALSSETIPCDIQTNSLDICTFMRKSKGDYYFFATNTSPNQIKVRFNSPSYGAPEVIFENRSINKNKSGFEDSFFPHETHIYRLKKNKD